MNQEWQTQMQEAFAEIVERLKRVNRGKASLGLIIGLFVWAQFSYPGASDLGGLTEVGFDETQENGQHKNSEARVVLEYERKIQQDFQHRIEALQFPKSACNQQRIGITTAHPRKLDGFALETHFMGRLLLAALATNRTLVVRPSWESAYAPMNQPCQGMEKVVNKSETISSSWECLYQPISNCTWDLIGLETRDVSVPSYLSTGMGLTSGASKPNSSSKFFDVYFHGPTRIADMIPTYASFKRETDHVPAWERLYGRFWLRAQLQHFLWKPSHEMQQHIQARTPAILSPPNQTGEKSTDPARVTPYVGIHLRLTDNAPHFKRDFGRDVLLSRSVERIEVMLEKARRDFPMLSLNHVYISTDNAHIVDECKRLKNWTVLIQDDVIRSDSQNMMWFRNSRSKAGPGIATDLEVMRRADVLIGSFQSNVFRLAAELNMAYHTGRYRWGQVRHYSFDVEWYEDP